MHAILVIIVLAIIRSLQSDNPSWEMFSFIAGLAMLIAIVMVIAEIMVWAERLINFIKRNKHKLPKPITKL